MNIDETVKNYQENGNSQLIEYIQGIVKEKQLSGDWDRGIQGQSQNLVTMLLYEYSTAIEKLTDGKVSSKSIVDKLSNQLGILRFGDFKNGVDDRIKYDNYSVTSLTYKEKNRIQRNTGAHSIKYMYNDSISKFAVALFDKNQKISIDGKEKKLYGIDLQNLSDIRGTIFHEWTHIMENCRIKTSNLKKEDIIKIEGNSTYINSSTLNPISSMAQFEEYIINIEKTLKDNDYVEFNGISTIEIKKQKDSNNRIIHNKISEGATEFITREIMNIVGDKVIEPQRYAEQVRIIGQIFKENGLAKSITTYLTEPNKVIKFLEDKKIKGKDMLHYVSEYINDDSFIGNLRKKINPLKIDEKGNIEPSIFNKIKKFFFENNKKAKMLPKAEDEVENTNEGQRNKFIKELQIDTTKEDKQEKDNQHIMINKMISYGFAGNCVHLHMPIDLHNMIHEKGVSGTIGIVNLYLLDAIDKINEMKLNGTDNFKDKSSIYMISPILMGNELKLLNDLGFDTKIFTKSALSDEQFVSQNKEAQLAKKIFGINKNIATANITFNKISTQEYQNKRSKLIEEYKSKGIIINKNEEEKLKYSDELIR